MKKKTIQTFALILACLSAAATCVSAKDPRALKPASLLPVAIDATGSLTPPPKEWAMFPQDEPPPQAAQAPKQAGQNPAASNASATGTENGSSGLVSAANVRSVPRRELPLFWMLLTGALSFGAIAACGSLILRKDIQDSTSGDEIPIVPEHLEVKA